MDDLAALYRDESRLAGLGLRVLMLEHQHRLAVFQHFLPSQRSLSRGLNTDVEREKIIHDIVARTVKLPGTMFQDLTIDPLHGLNSFSCSTLFHLAMLSKTSRDSSIITGREINTTSGLDRPHKEIAL